MKCTGCGVEIQTKDPEAIGYMSKTRIENHQKKLDEMKEFQSKKSMIDGLSGQDKHIVEYLRDQNVSEEVLLEFTRSQVDNSKASPEILDLNTLLQLD